MRLSSNSVGICQCTVAICLQVPRLCTDLDLTLFYILIPWTYGKFARQNKRPALNVCFPQTCSSASRMFATLRSRLHYYWQIISFANNEFDEMSYWTGFSWESAFVREIHNPLKITESIRGQTFWEILFFSALKILLSYLMSAFIRSQRAKRSQQAGNRPGDFII